MPLGEFAIRLTLDPSELKKGLEEVAAGIQKVSKNFEDGARRSAPAVGKIERMIQDLNKRVLQANTFTERLTAELQRDLLRFTNVFVRRVTFSLVSRLETIITGFVRSIGRLFRTAVELGSEFEDAMLKTAGVVAQGVTENIGDAFNSLQGIAREIGRTTVFTASEAATAMFELASVGLTVDEIQDAIAASAAFAAAAQTDLTVATDILTQVMKAFNLTGDQMSNVSDILIFALDTTTLNVQRLQNALRFAAPSASAFGVSLEDMVNVVSQFVDVTKQGGISGRAFRFMLQALASPSGKAAKAIERLGLSVRDVSPVTNNLVDILRRFALSSLNAGDAAVIFGRRAGPVVSAFIDRFRINLLAGIDILQSFRDNVKNAAELAQRQSDIFLSSITNQFRIFISKATDLGIQLFFFLRPGILRSLKLMQDGMDVLLNNFGALTRMLPSVRTAILALTAAMAGFLGAVRSVKVALFALNLAFASVSAIVRAGLAVALIFLLATAVRLEGGLSGLWESLAEGVTRLSDVIANTLRLDGRLTALFDSAFEKVTGFTRRSVEEAEKFKGGWEFSLDGVARAFEDTFAVIRDQQVQQLRFIAQFPLMGKAFGFLADKLDEHNRKVRRGIRIQRSLRESLKATTDAQREAERRFKSVLDTLSGGLDTQEKVLAFQLDFVKAFQRMKSEFGETAAINASTALFQRLQTVMERLGDNAGPVFIAIFKKVEAAIKANAELTDDYIKALDAARKELLGFVPGEALAKLGFFEIIIRELISSGQTLSQKAIANIIKALKDLIPDLKLSEDFTQRVKERIDDLISSAKSLGEKGIPPMRAMGTVLLGIPKFVDPVIKKYNELGILSEKQLGRAVEKLVKDFDLLSGRLGKGGLTFAAVQQFAEEVKALIPQIRALPPDDEDRLKFKALVTVLEGMGVTFEKTGSKGRNIMNSISREFGRAIAEMIVNAENFQDAIRRLFTGLFRDFFFNAVNSFVDAFNNGLDGAAKKGRSFVNKMKDGFTAFKESVQGAAAGLLAGFGAAFGGLEAIAFSVVTSLVNIFSQAGSPEGAIMAAIGAAIGIIRHFLRSDMQDFARGVKRIFSEFGVLTDALAEKLGKLADELKDQGRRLPQVVASIVGLADVLREKGVPSAAAFLKAMSKLQEAILRFNEGIVTEKELLDALNDSFPILIENLDKMDRRGQQALRNVIEGLRAAGIQSEVVREFVKTQAETIISSIQDLITAFTFKTAGGLTEVRLNADQVEFSIFALLTAFAELSAEGFSVIEILNMMGDSAQIIAKRAEELGIELPESFKQILGLGKLFEIDVVKRSVDGLTAMQNAFKALINLGIRPSEEEFDRLEAQAFKTFNTMIDNGATGRQALLSILPTLAFLRDMSERFGFELDENTQKLITQAEEAGLLTDRQKSMEEILSKLGDVLDRLADLLDKLTGGMGKFVDTSIRGLGKIIQEANSAGSALHGAFSNLPDFGTIGLPVFLEDVVVAQQGVALPNTPNTVFPVLAHPGEVIAPPETIVAALSKALQRSGISGAGGQVILRPTFKIEIGRRELREILAKEIREGSLEGQITVFEDSVHFFQ